MSRRLKLSLIIITSLQLISAFILLALATSVITLINFFSALLIVGILAKVLISDRAIALPIRENFDAFKEMSNHIAHDFSNPMHVIQFCGSSLANYVSPEGEKYLDRIRSSADRSVSMIEELREISKVKNREHKTFDDVHRFVVALLRVEFWRYLKKSSIHLDKRVRSLLIGIEVEDLIIFLHTVYRSIICQHDGWSPIVEIMLDSIKANGLELSIVASVDFSISDDDDEKLRKRLSASGSSFEVVSNRNMQVHLKGFFEDYSQIITATNNSCSHDETRLQ